MTNLEKLRRYLENRGSRLIGISWGPGAEKMTTEERAGAMLDFIKTMDRGGYEVIGHYGPWHWRLLMWLKDIPRRIRRSIRIAAPAK